MNSSVSVCRRIAGFLALGLAVHSNALQGATVRVDVGDNFFRPATTNIVAGDSVRWVWIGFVAHTSTHSGSPRLWDSGQRSSGSFTNTFASPGSYPYFCTLHLGQTGTINVGAGNTPPTVTMQFPTNGTAYATPGTVRLTATASDANGTVTNVQFLRSDVLLGNDPSSPYEGVDNNPPTGSLVYRAIATDNLGDKATNSVTVSVVSPVAVQLANQVRLSPTQFRFTYTGNPGLHYVVEKSASLSAWQRLGTNRATGASTTFTDDSATASQGAYRVGRLPNP